MTNTLLNGVLNIMVQAILSILGVVATYLITVAVSYFKKKREALIKQMGIDKYNANYNIAKSVYFSVEQLFKFIPAAAEQKRKMFDSELIKKVPTLTQEELDHFREAVVGEVNSQIKQSQILQPTEGYNPQKEIADPVQTNQETNTTNTTTIAQ
jgi:hypothetical protein